MFASLNTAITATPQRTSGESETPHRASRRAHFQSSTFPRETTALQHFQKTDLYRMIVDNNLFRPLGWTPPRPTESYRLIGTVRSCLARRTHPKAVIQSTAGHQTYIVSTGGNLDAETEVVSIQDRTVVLSTNGEQERRVSTPPST